MHDNQVKIVQNGTTVDVDFRDDLVALQKVVTMSDEASTGIKHSLVKVVRAVE